MSADSAPFGQEIRPHQIVSSAYLVNIRVEWVLAVALLACLENMNRSANPPIVHFVLRVHSFLELEPRVRCSAKHVLQTFSLLLDLILARLIVQRGLTRAVK